MEKNKIAINQKTLEKSKKIEVYGDIIVPDIKPDIVNIINSNANTYIYKVEISENRIRMNGNIDANIIYLADNGETRCIQSTLNFDEIFEDSTIKSEMKIKEGVNLLQIESKILNERKISIKASLMLKAEAWEKEEVEFINKIDESLDIQKLEENLQIQSLKGNNSAKTSLKENIKVASTSKIAEILKTNVELGNFENKISYNKILSKADAFFRILYLTEENKIEKIETTLPVMSFIEMSNVSDSDNCNIEYKIRNMLYKIDSKEMNSIDVQIDFDIDCEVYENREITVVQDMYSTKNNIKFNKKDAFVKLVNVEKNESIKIEERILIEDIALIYDVDSTLAIMNKTVNNNIINYEGEANLNILFEADNRNGLNMQNIKIPFVFKSDVELQSSNLKIERKEFNANNEYVNCNLEISINKNESNMRMISIIDNIETEEMEEENEYKMIVYFVKKGDTIWKIAKRFKVCMNSIIKLNNLENPDRINVGDRLYIMK